MRNLFVLVNHGSEDSLTVMEATVVVEIMNGCCLSPPKQSILRQCSLSKHKPNSDLTEDAPKRPDIDPLSDLELRRFRKFISVAFRGTYRCQ